MNSATPIRQISGVRSAGGLEYRRVRTDVRTYTFLPVALEAKA